MPRKFILLLMLLASSFLVYSQTAVSSKKYFTGEKAFEEFYEEIRKASKNKNNRYGYIKILDFEEYYYKTLDDGTGDDAYFLTHWKGTFSDTLIYFFRYDRKNSKTFMIYLSNSNNLDKEFSRGSLFMRKYYLRNDSDFSDLMEDWNTLMDF